jgi:hypothetical protein
MGWLKRHGWPALVTSVNNAAPELGVTLFETGHAGLLAVFQKDKPVSLAVADTALRTVHPGGAGGMGGPDSVPGSLVEKAESPAQPGSSGIRLVIKPTHMLEGFRPGRVIRICPEGWYFDVLPPEERIQP